MNILDAGKYTKTTFKKTSYGYNIHRLKVSAQWLSNNTQIAKKMGLEQELHLRAPSFMTRTKISIKYHFIFKQTCHGLRQHYLSTISHRLLYVSPSIFNSFIIFLK